MKAWPLLNLTSIILTLALSQKAAAQSFTCGQPTVTAALLAQNPAIRAKAAQIEQNWRSYLKRTKPGIPTPLGNPVITLPIVVHIIHDNGPENISDAQVQTAIRHLNEAYANIGYFDPSDGADTHIQFCLTQRDPDNAPTNGITRDVSPYTNMGGSDPSQDDLNVKNVNRWDPYHYINIWIVRSIPGAVAGFAYLPAAHGSFLDGIVVEAQYFGVTEAYDVVVTHEMGHYLGLYHTFEGGCTNNDCSLDGDRVCDTPPDQSTAWTACGQTMNSCSTDALSGFSLDENDLTKDYMDYGNNNCMTIFTQGQVDRMNWSIQNIRMSLLASKACLPPCPSPVTAGFTFNPGPVTPGATFTFTNQSVNASAYSWYVNGIQQSNNANLTYTFPAAGLYAIRLVATAATTGCYDAEKDTVLSVVCPADASFTPTDTTVLINTNAHFDYTGANAASWQWWLDGTAAATGPGYDVSFATAGDHLIRLVVTDGNCSTERNGHLKVIDPADSCSIHTFQKSMPGVRSEVAWDASVDLSGNYLVSGLTSAYGPAQINGFAMKLNPAGDPVWAKSIGDAGNIRIGGGKALDDGSSILGGSTQERTNRSAAILIKLDDGGGLQWAKKYTATSNSISVNLRVFQLRAGGYILCSGMSSTASPVQVIRTDAAGNLLWAKVVLDAFAVTDEWMLEDNGRLIVSVQGFSLNAAYDRGVIFALDETSGNFLWGKSFDHWGFHVDFGKIYAYQGAYLVSMTYGYQFGFVKVDRQGNLLSAYAIQDPAESVQIFVSDLAIGVDQSITVICSVSTPESSRDVALVKISAAGGLLTAKKYPQPLAQTIYRIVPAPDLGYFACGSTNGTPANNGLYFLKTDSALRLFTATSGGTSCQVVPFTPEIVPATLTVTPVTTNSRDAGVTASDYQPQVTGFTSPLFNFCEDPVACSLLTIIGNDTACGYRDSLLLTAHRNRDCGAKVTWTVDDPATTLTQPTDSTVSLHFSKPGKTLLHSVMNSGCHIFTDSVYIEVPVSPDTVDLGPDIVLCTQSTIRLSAGPGFRSYLWQNGSEDSTFTAWLPGTYWVIATDYCNIPHGDTITITTALPPTFDLGPDATICIGDSIRLSAPEGFDAYHWSPDYRLANPDEKSTYASPVTDTVYTCTAVKGPGCSVSDTIRIKVNPCRKGLFFPGAFTPNKDGANDLYRPVIIGAPPVEYYLAIYNRTGQLVFETRNPSAGWDGNVRGIPSVTNSFVWVARYRLPGEQERLEKGVLVLVR